jgi:hypothetical protein
MMPYLARFVLLLPTRLVLGRLAGNTYCKQLSSSVHCRWHVPLPLQPNANHRQQHTACILICSCQLPCLPPAAMYLLFAGTSGATATAKCNDATTPFYTVTNTLTACTAPAPSTTCNSQPTLPNTTFANCFGASVGFVCTSSECLSDCAAHGYALKLHSCRLQLCFC